MRRQHEDEILGHYHQVLVQQGVRDYSLAALRNDYTLSTLISLSGFIGNVTSVDPANERGEELFALLLGRSAKAVMDLGALDLLPTAD